MLVEHQWTIMEQLVSTQAQANTKPLGTSAAGSQAKAGASTTATGRAVQPVVRVQKMIPMDDPKAFMNVFKRTSAAAAGPEGQYASSV